MSSNAHVPARREPPVRQNRTPWVAVVVIVIFLTAGLLADGVAPPTAVGTLSAAGLAAVEILRRLAAIPAPGVGCD